MLSQTFALSLLTSDINDAKNELYICYDVLLLYVNLKIQNSVARGTRRNKYEFSPNTSGAMRGTI